MATINVGGLGRPEKRAAFFGWCRQMSLDVILVQETHCSSPAHATDLNTEWGATGFWSVGDNTGGTAVLLSRAASSWNPQIRRCDPRTTIIDLDIDGVPTTLVNVYAPNNAKNNKAFFTTLADADWDPDRLHLLAGDFNSVVDPSLDRPGQTFAREDPSALLSLTHRLGLVDLWRQRNPTSTQVSRRSARGTAGSRIDRWYLPPVLAPQFTGPSHVPATFSDHDAVIFDLQPLVQQRSAYWKLNASLLHDPDYSALILMIVKEVATNNPFLCSSDLWERMKGDIRAASKAYSARKAASMRARILALHGRLAAIEAAFPISRAAATSAAAIRLEINTDLMKKIRAARVRSRTQWHDAGERPSRYFSALEKSRKAANLISSITTSSGTVTSQPDLEREAMAFYEDLYTASITNPHDQDRLLDVLTPSSADLTVCEGSLTSAELASSVHSAPRNKSPGPDGLPFEFYKTFWDTLGGYLLRAANDSFAKGHLTTTQKLSFITLLHKKGDKDDLGNWRPISLLCCDAKLISKAIYSRLAKVVTSVIGPHQTATPGRYIHHHTRLVQDMLDFGSQRRREGGLLFLDQQKAFDRVDWGLLDRIVERLGFGPDFLKWLRVLRHGSVSRVIVNGRLTDPVNLQRGVRQGDALSPLLFCLAIEALANAINTDPSITGFELPGSPKLVVKSILYADDTAIAFSSAADLLTISDWLACYERASGAAVNRSKSAGVVFHGDPERFAKVLDVPWSLATVATKYLGIQVGHNLPPSTHWDPIAHKVEASLASWSRLHLSLTGLRSVLNTYAMSKLWYTASVVPLPKQTADQLLGLLHSFLCKGRRMGPVKKEFYHVSPKQGGLGLLHPTLQAAKLRAKWVAQLLDPSDAPWKRLARHYLANRHPLLERGHAELLCQEVPATNPAWRSPFWEAAIIAFKLRTPLADPSALVLTPEQWLGLPLWQNPFITRSGLPIHWTEVIKPSTLTTLYQLYLADGTPKSFNELALLFPTGVPPAARPFVHRLVQLAKELQPRVTGATPPILRADSFFAKKPPAAEWFAPAPTPPAPAPPVHPDAPDLRWPRVWRTTHSNYAQRKWNDTHFRLLHRALPLGHRTKHYVASSEACQSCRAPTETPKHTFLDCAQAKKAWMTANGILRSLNILPFLAWAQILDPVLPASRRHASRRRRELLAVVHRATIHAIWLCRCERVFAKSTADPSAVLKKLLQDHALTLARHRPYFALLASC